MARVSIPEEDRSLTDSEIITTYLATFGVDYERWRPDRPIDPDAQADEILGAYAKEIEDLKARGGYVTADIIDVSPDTTGLEAMLARFNREHWHDEDEVRFVIAGHGLFHINPQDRPVVAIEVEAGDLIRVPRGTRHWFNLCADRRIRAIRLFQNVAGWTPNYTDSGTDRNFAPVCFSAADLPRGAASES